MQCGLGWSGSNTAKMKWDGGERRKGEGWVFGGGGAGRWGGGRRGGGLAKKSIYRFSPAPSILLPTLHSPHQSSQFVLNR